MAASCSSLKPARPKRSLSILFAKAKFAELGSFVVSSPFGRFFDEAVAEVESPRERLPVAMVLRESDVARIIASSSEPKSKVASSLMLMGRLRLISIDYQCRWRMLRTIVVECGEARI